MAVDGVRIETARLLLRRFEARDVDELARIYADPSTTQWLGDGSPRAREETSAEIERFRALYRERGYGPWAVCLRDSGVLIGHCGLQDLDGGPEAALTWALSREWRGRGYATEAAMAALRDAFDGLKLPRVSAVAQAANVESIRVMQKLGMKLAGEETHYGKRVLRYEVVRSS
jgi:RimJ/RimL family protein N-acetyltransferase